MKKIFVEGSWKGCETTGRKLSMVRDSGEGSSAGCETTGREAESAVRHQEGNRVEARLRGEKIRQREET
jgi:hypothetical protein